MARTHTKILVVDDDASTRDGLAALLQGWGYSANAVPDGDAALKLCEKELPHAIVTDLMMPGMSGLEFVKALGERVQQVAIVVLTGQATIETAVQAIKLGAYDYLPKPLDAERLRSVLERGLKQLSLAREAGALRQRLESPWILRRPDREIRPLNCPAISPTLMESELFGHEKGAFTNAIERHQGCFEQADGGTLFLDEITEMAAEVQAKFLRVLEEGQVRRIGGTTSIPISVRVVAATNRAPAAAVKEGKLRDDLFYRLSVFHLELPPLRERAEDILLLARYFLESFAEKYQRPQLPWATDFAPALQAHSWPGNVRELRNAMERLAVLAAGPNLTAADFQQFCLSSVLEEKPDSEPLSLAEAERQCIERALAASGGNKTQAARLLGITPKTLNAKLALYNKE